MTKQVIRILLVEDNPGDARLIREALSESEKIDGRIDHADRLKELENLINGNAKNTYDVIILDLTLPDATGIETVKRAIQLARGSAIIVLSGISDEELAVKAVQEGAQDYLVKSEVNVKVLERVIIYALERNAAKMKISVLTDQLKQALLEIDDELEVSANIQRKIIQHDIPEFWRQRLNIYISYAKKIGGDLYAINPVGDDSIVFVVADGSGHSVHAALLSIMFKLSLHHQLPQSNGPGRLIENINNELQPFFLDNMFFTAFIAWYQPKKNMLVYSNAGHPTQYIISAGKGKLIPLKNKGIPLCINIDTPYEEYAIDIEDNDRLIMFTDGIYEFFELTGGKSGDTILREILEENISLDPLKLMKKITKKNESHHGGIINDDAALPDDSIFMDIRL